MEISAIGFGEEDDDGLKVWTEHLTEELPALMERMMLAILMGCQDGSRSQYQLYQCYKFSGRVCFE